MTHRKHYNTSVSKLVKSDRGAAFPCITVRALYCPQTWGMSHHKDGGAWPWTKYYHMYRLILYVLRTSLRRFCIPKMKERQICITFQEQSTDVHFKALGKLTHNFEVCGFNYNSCNALLFRSKITGYFYIFQSTVIFGTCKDR